LRDVFPQAHMFVSYSIELQPTNDRNTVRIVRRHRPISAKSQKVHEEALSIGQELRSLASLVAGEFFHQDQANESTKVEMEVEKTQGPAHTNCQGCS
jgi:mono/diheme cytochrome c family protein